MSEAEKIKYDLLSKQLSNWQFERSLIHTKMVCEWQTNTALMHGAKYLDWTDQMILSINKRIDYLNII